MPFKLTIVCFFRDLNDIVVLISKLFNKLELHKRKFVVFRIPMRIEAI